MKESPYKKLGTGITWSSPWFNIRSDQVRLPNGDETVYHVVQKAGAVWIVPVTNAGEIVLIYNYRYTVDDWCWEVPAGTIKPTQSPQEAALAELKEEIGGTARELHSLGNLYTVNGICNELGYFFLATGVQLGVPNHEPTEIMEIHPKPIKEVLHMARTGQIQDAQSVAALFLCESLLSELS